MTRKLDHLLAAATEMERAAWGRLWQTAMDCSSILAELDPIERPNWLSHIKRELHTEQNGRCARCGGEISIFALEIDHIIPFTYGGVNERSNLQLLCRACNLEKGENVDPIDLVRYLEDRYQDLR